VICVNIPGLDSQFRTAHTMRYPERPLRSFHFLHSEVGRFVELFDWIFVGEIGDKLPDAVVVEESAAPRLKILGGQRLVESMPLRLVLEAAMIDEVPAIFWCHLVRLKDNGKGSVLW
jgi:hypothetical protein